MINFFFNFVGPDLLNPGQYYIKVEAGNCYRNTYNDIAKCFSEVEKFQGGNGPGLIYCTEIKS